MKRTIPIRSDPNFKKMLEDIKLRKVREGKNNKILSDRRLTLAITRVPGLKELLIEREIKDDKK